MPLVTRQANQGNLFVEADEPQSWSNGDLWVDTDTAVLSVNKSGTAKRQASFTELIALG